MQASSSSQAPNTAAPLQPTNNTPQATEVSRKTSTPDKAAQPAPHPHAEGSCCGGCGG